MKLTKNIGMILLAVWLILSGLFVVVPSIGGAIPSRETLMSILAIAAGVLILLGR